MQTMKDTNPLARRTDLFHSLTKAEAIALQWKLRSAWMHNQPGDLRTDLSMLLTAANRQTHEATA